MNNSAMLGTWEFLIISVVVSIVVLPYFRKRAKQKRRPQQRSAPQTPATKRAAYRPPSAKSVPYEADDETSA